MFQPDIVGVMITGKTPARYPLARSAVESFFAQDYQGKKQLLILNDNPIPLYEEADRPAGVLQVGIQNVEGEPRKSLGVLRSTAIELAPKDGYIVQWDDDDFSHPTRLSYQVAATQPGTASIFRWQVQYDLKSGKCFAGCGRESAVRGFAGTMLFPANTAARFKDVPRGEDTYFLQDLRKRTKLTVLSNRPTLFFRLCHENNTWDTNHVMRRRPGSRDLTPHELKTTRSIIAAHYPQAVIQK